MYGLSLASAGEAAIALRSDWSPCFDKRAPGRRISGATPSAQTPRSVDRPCSSPKTSSKSPLQQALSPEDVSVLRRLSSQATRQVLAEIDGGKHPEEAEARLERVGSLMNKVFPFQQPLASSSSGSEVVLTNDGDNPDAAEGSRGDCGLVGLSDKARHLIAEIARLSAMVAAASTTNARRQQANLSLYFENDDIIRVRSELDDCVEALRSERELSASLVKHLRSLCWNTSCDAARKIAEPLPLGKTRSLSAACGHSWSAWKDEEFERRLNDVRGEIAADVLQEGARRLPEQPGWRGVNLGGWLLWEAGPADSAPVVKATGRLPMDEWTLSQDLRLKYGDEEAVAMMMQHRATYITKRDFEEIAALGMNSVRVPFSYWIISGPRTGEPFIGPSVEYLDNAFDWAEECGLKLILSFHGTVGCQSGHQASGRSDDDWDPKSWDPNASVEILRKVAARYKNRCSLGGITVVNEPSCHLPVERLMKYYRDAYRALRKDEGLPERVEIILSVYQRWFDDFRGIFTEKKGYRNVVFDVHIYHLFSDQWFKMSLAQHLRWADAQGKWHDAKEISRAGEKVIVSEWCLALPTWDFQNMVAWEWVALTRAERNAVLLSFGRRQLRTFASHAHGWFFWSWKDEDGYQWNLKQAMSRGLLPSMRVVPPLQGSVQNSSPVAVADALASKVDQPSEHSDVRRAPLTLTAILPPGSTGPPVSPAKMPVALSPSKSRCAPTSGMTHADGLAAAAPLETPKKRARLGSRGTP